MTTTRNETTRRSDVPGSLVVAAALGVVHAGFSLYWAAGGTLLIGSLGSDLVNTFRGREWLLVPVGAAKLVGAGVPLGLARRDWPAPRVTRGACWLVALTLIVWGGLNTTIGNLVLAGVIQPETGYDRPGMIGHAYLWDPLFLAWGSALAAGLVASRSRTSRLRGRGEWRPATAFARDMGQYHNSSILSILW